MALPAIGCDEPTRRGPTEAERHQVVEDMNGIDGRTTFMTSGPDGANLLLVDEPCTSLKLELVAKEWCAWIKRGQFATIRCAEPGVYILPRDSCR